MDHPQHHSWSQQEEPQGAFDTPPFEHTWAMGLARATDHRSSIVLGKLSCHGPVNLKGFRVKLFQQNTTL